MVWDESRYDDRATAEAARDAAPRGGRRTSGSGDAASGEECACGTETAGKSGFRLFTGDRVLWIIVAALAVISVLVVYSSTAKMAYDAHTARTTSHFLRCFGSQSLEYLPPLPVSSAPQQTAEETEETDTPTA